MSDFDPQSMTTDQLVEHFACNGVAQDKALLFDQFDDFNRHYGEMEAIRDELAQRGLEARLALMRLFGHGNMQVRLQAARFTLAVAPAAARNEIQAVADSRHAPQCFDAKGALRRFDEGFYTPV